MVNKWWISQGFFFIVFSMIPVPLVYVNIKSKMPCPRACILYMVYMVIRTDSRTALCPAARPSSVLVPRFVLCFVRTVTATCSHCSAAHHRWPCPGCPSSHQPRVLSIVPSSGSDTQSFVLSSHHLHSVPHENISAICIMKWLLMLTNCIAKLNCSVTVNYSVTLHNFDSMYTPTTHFAVWM